MRKLSKTQAAMLYRIAVGIDPGPTWGIHDAFVYASAWWRTFESLQRRGLVEQRSNGYGYRRSVYLTEAGEEAVRQIVRARFAELTTPNNDTNR